ncbi:hypothetical protein NLM16_39055 [Bradyrhizobium brasilense]|nr:hypothetical protein [Bradyrhizobium brasilense]
MTLLAEKVAQVQTATTLPTMLIALPTAPLPTL